MGIPLYQIREQGFQSVSSKQIFGENEKFRKEISCSHASKVGLAGIGFMGWIHWLAYGQRDDVCVSGIYSRDPVKRTGDWTTIQGNFGPPGEKVDLNNVQAFDSFGAMLADPSIDVVDLCTPPAAHVDAIVQAAEAGKHVFCEKPLALSLEECDRAVAACKANDRLLFVGQVLPYFAEYQFAWGVISSGQYGKLLGGHFKRVISDPTWLKDFYSPQIVGGPLLDLHVHDAHWIRLLFGMPQSAYSLGRRRGDVVEYCQSLFRFEDPSLVVSSASGVINQQGRPFTHGFEIHLEQATLQFEFAGYSDQPETMPLKLLRPDGSIERPDLGDVDPVCAFQREIGEVVDCLKTGEQSKILNGQLARDAIEICQMQAKSVASNHP